MPATTGALTTVLEAPAAISIRNDAAVWLVDPVQAWLELVASQNPPRFKSIEEENAASPSASMDSESLRGPLQTIRLPTDQFRVTTSKVVGSEFLRTLKEPVLADFSLSDDRHRFQQYFPLGDERISIRTLESSQPIENKYDIAERLSQRWKLIAEISDALS